MNKIEYITKLKVMKSYNKLPDHIKKVLRIEEGFYKLEIVENIFGNKYFLGHCELTPKFGPYPRCIRIKARDENDIEETCDCFISIEDVFYHECGHAIFNELTEIGINLNIEFNGIYEKEKNNLNYNSVIYIDKLDEYFAQSFSEYFRNPKELKENTPETYAFIEKTINDCKKLINK